MRFSKVTTEAALGLIGGTFGLFTGFSIISGVEIIFFTIKYMMTAFRYNPVMSKYILFYLRKRIKQRWGVVQAVVALQGMKKSKVSADATAEEKCVSSATSSRSFPYPTEFTKPQYPTKFEKPHYPTEFARPYYPTEFVGPNQTQIPTQTNLPETLSRWDKAIHQLVIQADMGKGPVAYDKSANENTSEPKAEVTEAAHEPSVARNRWGKVAHQLVNERRNRSVAPSSAPQPSYSPSLPAPEGPFPPPAFAYNSPAHGPKTTSGPGNGPALARWNNIFQQLANQTKKGEGGAVSESELGSTPSSPLPPPPSPPSAPPVITCTPPEEGGKALSATKVKTA